MDVLEFEQRLYKQLLNHLNGKYDVNEYLDLLSEENSSILNYILSHAYFMSGDKEKAEKYRIIAVEMNSNFDFESDYENIALYIYMMFCTITSQTNPFLDDEIDAMLGENPAVGDFLKVSNAYRNLNDISNAVRITELAQKKFPDEDSFKYDMASNLFYTRRLDSAWGFNEMRFDAVRDKLPQYVDRPKFELQKTSARVYVYPVTKIGDTIFFTRYLMKLRREYPKIKIFANPDEGLKLLFEENGIRTYGKPEKSMVDYQISFEGLPVLFSGENSKILTGGYLKANEKRVNEFRRLYFGSNKFKVGVVWRTSVPDDSRNIPIDVFSALFSIEGVQFYSLERDIALGEEMVTVRNSIPNLGVKLSDFSETAALIDNLDMVIGCDTSVTNLSGAMGKKTLLILPYNADWRWGLYEQNSEWYDSVTIFRQKQNCGYDEVMLRVKSYVEDLLKV